MANFCIFLSLEELENSEYFDGPALKQIDRRNKAYRGSPTRNWTLSQVLVGDGPRRDFLSSEGRGFPRGDGLSEVFQHGTEDLASFSDERWGLSKFSARRGAPRV